MKRLLMFLVLGLVGTLLLAGAASAKRDKGDARQRMDLLYSNPSGAVNSDLAFWGNYAFAGYYTGDAAAPDQRRGARSSTSRTRRRPRW